MGYAGTITRHNDDNYNNDNGAVVANVKRPETRRDDDVSPPPVVVVVARGLGTFNFRVRPTCWSVGCVHCPPPMYTHGGELVFRNGLENEFPTNPKNVDRRKTYRPNTFPDVIRSGSRRSLFRPIDKIQKAPPHRSVFLVRRSETTGSKRNNGPFPKTARYFVDNTFGPHFGIVGPCLFGFILRYIGGRPYFQIGFFLEIFGSRCNCRYISIIRTARK